jgi:hypothetical protein
MACEHKPWTMREFEFDEVAANNVWPLACNVSIQPALEDVSFPGCGNLPCLTYDELLTGIFDRFVLVGVQ